MKELDVMDNFLPLDQFSIIENSFKNLRFPWLFVPQAYGCERSQLVHEFWNPIGGFISDHNQLVMPFIKRLQPSAILKIKANLQPRHDKIVEDPLHVDFSNISATTSIFYINTSNGYTHFEDGTKVKSVANRLVTFPTHFKHGGACCTDQVSRIVLNINYHKYYYKGGV